MGVWLVTIEEQANEVALWNPGHAIEGWASGYEAAGNTERAAICRRALAIQQEWRDHLPNEREVRA